MAWKPFQSKICIDFDHSSSHLEELWPQGQGKAAQMGPMMRTGGKKLSSAKNSSHLSPSVHPLPAA